MKIEHGKHHRKQDKFCFKLAVNSRYFPDFILSDYNLFSKLKKKKICNEVIHINCWAVLNRQQYNILEGIELFLKVLLLSQGLFFTYINKSQ